MARKPKKGRVVSVDMEGVDMSGGTGFHIPEGDYKLKVKSVEEAVSKNDNEQLKWVFTGLEGKAKNKDFYYYTPLTEESLWKLGLTLKALGQDVPDSMMEIDLDELEGLECMGNIIDDEYNNKTRSKLQSVEALDDDEPETETSKAAGKAAANGKTSKKTVVKLETDEVNAMAEDELEELIEKHELEVDLGDHKTLRRKVAAVVAALEEADLLAA